MSQRGSTLSLYPSSVTCYNSATTTPSNNNNMNDHHHHSSSDDDDDHDPSSKNGGGGGKSRRELPSGAVATLKAWLLAPEHFTHPYPTPQDQIMLMQKTGIDKKQLKNWFTNARRRIWKPMLKKQLEAGKLAAGVSLTATAAAASTSGGGGDGGVPVPELTGSYQQQQQYSQQQHQEPQQEMYSNFQQAQSQMDPSSSYEQQQQQYHQQQQQVQYLQEMGQMHQQPVYDQYGNQIYDTTASYQQQYPYQQDSTTTTTTSNHQSSSTTTSNSNTNTSSDNPNFPISNSIGSLAPMTLSSMEGSTASFGNSMVKTDSHAVLMELFARDQDLVRQAARGVGGGGVVGRGHTMHAVGGGQSQQGMTNNHSMVGSGAVGSGGGGGGVSSASPPGSVRWAAGAVGSSSSSGGPVLQKQHSVTFEGVPSLSSWPHFSSVSSLNNLGGLQGVKSITNLSAADLSSQGNLNKMGNLAHVKSIENMGRFDSFAFLEVFFDDKSGLNSSTNSGQRGVKRERDDDDAIGLSLDGDDGTSPGQFNNNNSNSKTPADQDPAAESGGSMLSDERKDSYEGNDIMDGGTLKRAYDDALAARGLIAVRRSCEKLTDLALPAKMQRTLSQEYIRQHNQGQPMGDFFSTNNSAYAPNSNRNNNNNCSPHVTSVGNGGVGNGSMSDRNNNDNMVNASSVEVPSSTTCTLCMLVNVDTQLRPCGHMFHGRCLKPSLQNTVGPPKCPICSTSMQSAILAVPSAATECGG